MTDIIVPDHVAFVRQNGTRIHSLSSLREALFAMDDTEYSFHVHSHKNDFASWIEHVFADKPLAHKLLHTTNKYEAIRVLDEELAERVSIRGVFKKGEDVALIEEVKLPTLAPQLTSDVKEPQFLEAPKKSVTPASRHRGLELHEQIHHLDKQLAHMTKHHAHTAAHHPGGEAAMDETIKGKIIDFTLGLIVGLMLGFVLARSIGIF